MFYVRIKTLNKHNLCLCWLIFGLLRFLSLKLKHFYGEGLKFYASLNFPTSVAHLKILCFDSCIANFLPLCSVPQSEFHERDTFYIFNHVDIKIYYHVVETGSMGARLVAAKLEPKR